MSSTILQRSGWPSAWELWVRRPDTEWRRYSIYETHEQDKATMKRAEGPPLELKIVPLYAVEEAMSKELIERLRSNFPTTQAQWEAADRIEELERERDALQAKIDELMLEHCPDEMTQEQLNNYAANQKAVST